MRSLNATQQGIIAASRKVVSWLFQVDAGSDTYYWSTGNKSYGGNAYTFMIEPGSFSGITLSRPGAGSGIIAPNRLAFSVLNASGSLSAADFDGADVTVRLVMSDFSTETGILSWKFRVRECVSEYKRLKFECQDFLQEYLRGDYPKSRLAKDIFVSNDTNENDKVCPPVPFGTCFVPLRSVYVSSARRYLLGPASKNYTLTKVRTPRAYGSRSNWASGSIRNASYKWTASSYSGATNEYYLEAAAGGDPGLSEPAALYIGGSLATEGAAGGLSVGEWGWGDTDGLGFDTVYVRLSDGADPDTKAVDHIFTDTYPLIQEDETGDDGNSYTVLKPLIADSDNDGVADAVGLWRQGSNFLDMPVKFSRSDTASLTSPEQAIEFFLEDIGVPSADLDTGSASTFDSAGDDFATRGLAFNGAFWEQQTRKAALSTLLTNCHATLDITDKVELRVLSATSQKTVTSSDVVRAARKPESTPTYSPGPFRYQTAEGTESDSGYVKWQQADEIQDEWLSSLVPFDGSSSGTSDEPGRDSLTVPFVQDSRDVQRLGTLHFQRKYRKATVSFLGMPSLLALQPDDVITINDTLYGGSSYDVVVETMTIRPNGSIDFKCFRPQFALQDWADFTPAAIAPATDDTAQGDAWEPVTGGPSSAENMGSEYNLFARMTDTPWIVISPTAGEGMFTTLEDAVDYLAGLSGLSSAKIYAKNGTYAIPTGPIALPDINLDIEGQSRGGVVFRNKAGSHFLVLEDITNRVNLKNFTVQSQNSGIYTAMVRVSGTSPQANTVDLLVDGLMLELASQASPRLGDTGIQAEAGEGVVRVLNSTVSGGSWGISVGSVGRIFIRDNDVSGCNQAGIAAAGAEYGNIAGCKLTDNLTGIWVSDYLPFKRFLIDGNNILSRDLSGGGRGIYIANGSDGVVVTGNSVSLSDPAAHGAVPVNGIEIVGSSGVQVADASVIIDSRAAGEICCVLIRQSTDTLLAKSYLRFDNNGDNTDYHYGVKYVASERNTMSDCVVDGANNHLMDCVFLWDANSHSNKYDGNMSRNTGTDGINYGTGNLIPATNMNN